MGAIGDAFLKMFNPSVTAFRDTESSYLNVYHDGSWTIAIKVTSLEDKSVTCLLHEIHDVVKERYETALNTIEDVIYLGKRK